MARVLLVKQPYEIACSSLTVQAGIPLRTAYLAAILQKHGIEYDVLDLNIMSIEHFGPSRHNSLVRSVSSNPSIWAYIGRNSSTLRMYLEYLHRKLSIVKGYDFVGVNGDNALAHTILRSCRRHGNARTVLGGSSVTANPYPYLLNRLADYVCLGRAEVSLPLIVKGRKAPNIIHAGKGSMAMELQDCSHIEILRPDYSKIRLGSYFKYFNYAPISASFGCNSACSYCSFKGRIGYASRSIQDVLAEIDYFIKTHGIRNFVFYDNYANIDNRRLEELCDGLIERKVRWMALFRPSGLPPRLISKIAGSGCRYAFFGVETTSRRLQKKMKKNLDLAEAGRIIRRFKKHDICTRLSFIYDLPGETLNEFLDCFRYARQSRADFQIFFRLSFYPGTELTENVDSYYDCTFNRDGKPTIIRSRRNMIDTAIKTVLANNSNKRNSRKWHKNPGHRRFYYKKPLR